MKQKLPLLILIITGLLITFIFYSKVVLKPDNYMFAGSGDGLKNYFTYSYHIKHDTSLINFEGMNYPYGEHFMYTDCHPVLTVVFKAFSGLFPFLGNHSVGILNFLMILSVFLTFIVVYLLLIELSVIRWFSFLFAIGITLLAPQIFRLGGHLALSYSVAIPLSWLLIIRSLKSENRLKYVIWIFLNNLFWFFIHAYLGMIISFFLILILVFFFIAEKARRHTLRKTLSLFISLILPVILFFLFVKITDTHIGRTDNPSGFFQYVAEADDVFVPNHPPLRPLLDSLTGNGIRQQWEAWSYVGISTTLLILLFIFMGIFRLLRRKQTAIDRFFNSRIVNVSLIAAFTILLFAMAVPFRQLPTLVDWIPYIKEFRALGRFTWPFFFVSTAFSAFVISQLYVSAENRLIKGIATGMALAAFALNVTESVSYHREVSYNITRTHNLFSTNYPDQNFLQASESFQSSDFQAIIALPFFYQGSESYSRPGSEKTTQVATLMSYHSGLPMVNANLTRTSVQESKKIVQIISPDYYPKLIAADLTDKRPFLIVRTTDPVSDYEAMLLKKCQLLHSNPDISILKLEVDDLLSSGNDQVWNEFISRSSLLHPSDDFLVSYPGFLYYNSFEDRRSEKVFRGVGGFEGQKRGRNVLAEFAPGTFEKGKDYHVSAWMFNGRQDALNLYFRFMVEEYDEKQHSWTQTTFFPDQSETIYGDWSMPEFSFRINNPESGIYIVTLGPRDARGPLYIDDLLVRESGMDVFRKDSTALFYNNHNIVLHTAK